MPKRRGRKASLSGSDGEEQFEALANAAGFASVPRGYALSGGGPTIEMQPMTYKPWGTKRHGRQDFAIRTSCRKALVQVKNQNQGGSTNEKLPFSFHLFKANPGHDEYWLVLLGIDWQQRPELVTWIRELARATQVDMPRKQVLVLEGAKATASALKRFIGGKQ